MNLSCHYTVYEALMKAMCLLLYPQSSSNSLQTAASNLSGSKPVWTFINQYKSSIFNNKTSFTQRAKKVNPKFPQIQIIYPGLKNN